MNKDKRDFSVYRNKTRIGLRLEQAKAHEVAKADAQEQSKKGMFPTYILRGTFADGKHETRIGIFNSKQNRVRWKFAKPN